MSPADLEAIVAREFAASWKVSQLCSGNERWTMSIPARPDRDHDLIIARSLQDVLDLVAEVRRLRGYEEPSDTCPAVDTDPAGSACRPAMPYAEPKEQP